MVKSGRDPCAIGMAIITSIIALNVSRMFTCRRGAIVASGARSRHVCMVKPCGDPCTIAMTIITGVIALNVSRMFTRCRGAIMASETCAGH